MNFKKMISLMIALNLLTSCFEDEVSPNSPNSSAVNSQGFNPEDPNFFESEFGFPMDEAEELVELDYLRRSECIGNIDCSISDLERRADDFTFKSGKLILRGNLVKFDSQSSQWMINENLEVTTFALNSDNLVSKQESNFHLFTNELRPFYQLVDGLNVNLEQPVKPVFVTESKLGINERSYRDPGLCDIFAAEKFERLSQTPWAKYDDSNDSSNYTWPTGTGMFNENRDLFAAETIVICGEINIKNRTLKLEAKNIIFYNSDLKITSDRDMPSGLRINAENIGYFGANLIESNIINKITGQKNATAPTIDIGASGSIVQIQAPVPANNPENAHYFKIFMAEINK